MVAPYCAATHCETGVSYVYTLFCRLPHETGGFRASRTRASLPARSPGPSPPSAFSARRALRRRSRPSSRHQPDGCLSKHKTLLHALPSPRCGEDLVRTVWSVHRNQAGVQARPRTTSRWGSRGVGRSARSTVLITWVARAPPTDRARALEPGGAPSLR